MFVKAMPTRGHDRAIVYPVTADSPVTFGSQWFDAVEQVGIPNLNRSSVQHIHGFDRDIPSGERLVGPAGSNETAPYWLGHYAWWENEHGCPIGVVVEGDLYLIGDDGKTIDRVR